jgi:hypothetical protein
MIRSGSVWIQVRKNRLPPGPAGAASPRCGRFTRRALSPTEPPPYPGILANRGSSPSSAQDTALSQ